MGVATVAGPILAGWLLHLDLFGSQWRSIFGINIPFGIAAFSLGWRVLPRRGGEDKTARLDLIGVGLLTAASALLITPLIEGRELGWPAWTYVMMAAAVVLLALFVVAERHTIQQFAGAIGVAALGTVFFARAGAAGAGSYVAGSYVAAAELVFGIAAGLYLLTLLLVGLLPKHARG